MKHLVGMRHRRAITGLALTIALIAVSALEAQAQEQAGSSAIEQLYPGGVSVLMTFEEVASALEGAGYEPAKSSLMVKNFQGAGDGVDNVRLQLNFDRPTIGGIIWSNNSQPDCYDYLTSRIGEPDYCSSSPSGAGSDFICRWGYDDISVSVVGKYISNVSQCDITMGGPVQ